MIKSSFSEILIKKNENFNQKKIQYNKALHFNASYPHKDKCKWTEY